MTDDEPIFNDPDLTPASDPTVDAFAEASMLFADADGIAPHNEVITVATTTYLEHLDPTDPPSAAVIEQQLLSIVNGLVRLENAKTKEATEKLPFSRVLTAWQVAQVMLHLHHVARIVFSGSRKLGALAAYAVDGPDMGTYVLEEEMLRRISRRYNTGLSLRDFAEVRAVLEEDAPHIAPARDRDLVGLNNGILDYKTKELRPFSPDTVLLAKARIDYIDSPTNPMIERADGSLWDVESWMNSLSDDPELVHLAWHVLGAILRPGVSWNVALMLFNELGNNGKGTFMSLAKNLVGSESWGALAIKDFEDRFRLTEIVNKTAFGADENDVGAFNDKMANFKAVITGDAVMIERKHKDPYWYEPRGLMVQCLNSLPKAKDVSQSYYRRLLFWKFDKCFTGREDKAIKNDYLRRPEVLEYVLWRVLNLPDYYELPVPSSSQMMLEEFKVNNDIVREFWEEIEDELVWGLQPQQWLHDLFTSWAARTNPRGGGLKKLEFYNRLKQIVAEDGRWEDGQWATSSHMDAPEPLIAEYSLTRWMNPHYSGSDPVKKSQPVVKSKYRGLRRVQTTTATDQESTDD